MNPDIQGINFVDDIFSESVYSSSCTCRIRFIKIDILVTENLVYIVVNGNRENQDV